MILAPDVDELARWIATPTSRLGRRFGPSAALSEAKSTGCLGGGCHPLPGRSVTPREYSCCFRRMKSFEGAEQDGIHFQTASTITGHRSGSGTEGLPSLPFPRHQEQFCWRCQRRALRKVRWRLSMAACPSMISDPTSCARLPSWPSRPPRRP